MKVLLWMIFWWAVLLRWEIHNMLINHICSPVLRAELWACRGLLSQRHASFFSQWPETGTHLHSLLSHSDDTASLSAERECTWCERIPHSLCAACVFKRFPQWFTFREECVESFVHIHFKPPIQAAKITMLNIFPTQPLRKRSKNNVSNFRFKCFPLFSWGLASVGVCSQAWRFVLTACAHSYWTHLHSLSLAHIASLKRLYFLTFLVHKHLCYSTNSVMPNTKCIHLSILSFNHARERQRDNCVICKSINLIFIKSICQIK